MHEAGIAIREFAWKRQKR